MSAVDKEARKNNFTATDVAQTLLSAAPRLISALGALAGTGSRRVSTRQARVPAPHRFRPTSPRLPAYWKDNHTPAVSSSLTGSILPGPICFCAIEALERRQDVRPYFRLPDWFVVDTPIGQYNPDWAIAMDSPGEEEGKPLLYRNGAKFSVGNGISRIPSASGTEWSHPHPTYRRAPFGAYSSKPI